MQRVKALLIIGVVLLAFSGCASAPVTPTSTAKATAADRGDAAAALAAKMVGKPYKYGGASPAGFDCSGLVTHVFQQVAGMVLPRNSQSMSKVGEKIDKVDLLPGDLVFFNTRRQPNSHVGIYIGDERFVHAPSRGGEVEISDMQEGYWKKRFNGARRLLNSD